MNSSVAVKSSDLSSHAVTLADNNPASKRLPSTLELKMRLPPNAALT
ncbi:3-deoxy-7-phosphoheptulonate synthase, partial [Pseudomonas syringae pv. actinidifoliorum]|nr:3-deoxy-7-phosphoheptulonate synthase [Pseudomonas syringae pv. actinidifoliorum]